MERARASRALLCPGGGAEGAEASPPATPPAALPAAPAAPTAPASPSLLLPALSALPSPAACSAAQSRRAPGAMILPVCAELMEENLGILRLVLCRMAWRGRGLAAAAVNVLPGAPVAAAACACAARGGAGAQGMRESCRPVPMLCAMSTSRCCLWCGGGGCAGGAPCRCCCHCPPCSRARCQRSQSAPLPTA